MKCDELKAETIVPQGCTLTLQMYSKSDVDVAIAELKQKLHDAEMQADLAECAVTEYKIDCDKLKSEADEVIDELKQKINEAQTELELWRDGCIISEAHQKELNELRHQKYKRCLAMAKWCGERIARIEKDYAFWRYGKDYASNFYKRWKKRWLELAEKFKEAK